MPFQADLKPFLEMGTVAFVEWLWKYMSKLARDPNRTSSSSSRVGNKRALEQMRISDNEDDDDECGITVVDHPNNRTLPKRSRGISEVPFVGYFTFIVLLSRYCLSSVEKRIIQGNKAIFVY